MTKWRPNEAIASSKAR